MIKMLDSQSRYPGFRTSKWFQVWLSRHYFEVGEMSMRYSSRLKACVCYFSSNFYFFTMKSVGLWKVFLISSKKLFSFSRYSNFCIFRTSFPHFAGTKKTNVSGIIYDVMNWIFKRISCMQWMFLVIYQS